VARARVERGHDDEHVDRRAARAGALTGRSPTSNRRRGATGRSGLRAPHDRATIRLVSRQAGIRGDSYGGRPPTSHERRAGEPWDASYRHGPAPWDTGQPQPAVRRLADEGAFAGAVLDAGCGTGENALHLAARGVRVLGVDVAETAVSIAREKAAARGIDAEFAVADALHLDRLDRLFDTVLDCGLLHTFDGDERRTYVASLASVTGRGGHVHLLCFSDAGPDTGPHPVSQEEVRAAFSGSGGWSIASLRPDRIETTFGAQGVPAWLAAIERTSAPATRGP